MDKIGLAFEQPVVFGFFLFLFLLGMFMASRFIGGFIRPVSGSMADALQAA